ncbi:YncE family protein [Shouchella sp. 1P09AA]|uniref:YncE family protein n=1 Tax=unclassified Shouchella TaxID=2893065 RepID=UPI0039A143AC
MAKSKKALLVIFIVLGVPSGCGYTEVAVPATGNPFAVVSHAKEPVLSYIDLETYEVIGSEKLNQSFTYMAKLDESTILATNQLEEELYLFDLEAHAIRPFSEIGQGLTKIVVSEQQKRVFVSDTQQNAVQVVDGKTGTITKSISIGAYPSDLVIDEEGQQVFVLSTQSNEVAIIDLINLTILSRFPVEENAAGLLFDGQHLWIGGHGKVGELNREVSVYDPESGKQIKQVKAGLMPVAIEADEKNEHLFFLSHGDHTLKKYSLDRGEVISTIEVGQNPNYMMMQDDKLFITNLDSDSVSVVDASTMKLEKEIDVSKGPYAIMSQF